MQQSDSFPQHGATNLTTDLHLGGIQIKSQPQTPITTQNFRNLYYVTLVLLPISLNSHHVNINGAREITKYKCGVASSDMMFVTSLMKIHELVTKLLGGGGLDRHTDKHMMYP
jgi:hypothetical protein